MASQHINLFQSKATNQPILAFVETYIKPATVILLTIVFTGGVMVALAFYFFAQQRDLMELERQQLLVDIKNNSPKESLFLMIRNRLTAVDAILASQVSYTPYIDTTIKIIQSFPLTSFSMGDKNSVAIGVTVTSLPEAVRVLQTMMEMDRRKEITNPVLTTFSMDEKKIQIGLSYTVVM